MHSHNSLAPPPHAGLQLGLTLLWDGIPFFNQCLLQVSQSGCLGYFGKNSIPGSSEHVADIRVNRPDGEGQSWQPKQKPSSNSTKL